jgi:hypothetical protein
MALAQLPALAPRGPLARSRGAEADTAPAGKRRLLVPGAGAAGSGLPVALRASGWAPERKMPFKIPIRRGAVRGSSGGAAQHLDQSDGNGCQAIGLGEDDTKAPQDQDSPRWLAEMGSIR